MHRRVTLSIKFVGIHHTWIERGSVRVKCAAQELNAITPVRPEPGLPNRETQTVLTTGSPRFPRKEIMCTLWLVCSVINIFFWPKFSSLKHSDLRSYTWCSESDLKVQRLKYFKGSFWRNDSFAWTRLSKLLSTYLISRGRRLCISNQHWMSSKISKRSVRNLTCYSSLFAVKVVLKLFWNPRSSIFCILYILAQGRYYLIERGYFSHLTSIGD